MQKSLIAGLLFMLVFNLYSNAQLKGDPWIFSAYKELYGRSPNAWELNINNYNLGSWNSYGELRSYIQQYQNSLNNSKLVVKTTDLANNQSAALFYQNGNLIAGNLISNTSGSIIGNAGGNLVANAGKLISVNHNTLQNLPAVSFGTVGTKYLATSDTKVITASGKGTLVIKK